MLNEKGVKIGSLSMVDLDSYKSSEKKIQRRHFKHNFLFLYIVLIQFFFDDFSVSYFSSFKAIFSAFEDFKYCKICYKSQSIIFQTISS